MKIAIHHRKGSFSDRWIEYCKFNNIQYKLVNAFDSDIIAQVKGCDVFMWHHHHVIYKDVLVAKKILFALEHAGITVFPNFNTAWHFDDKVAQKYLLEAIGAPLVPSYVFYDRASAMKWAQQASYPVVFKLKGGAGSKNVSLIKNIKECKRVISKAFSSGFSQYNKKNAIIDDLAMFKRNGHIRDLFKAISRTFRTPSFAKLHPKEKGYVYFQEYIRNSGFDIRVVIIGKRAVALKRLVRENDFRASGSGNLVFENENIDKRFIGMAFKLADKLRSTSLAVDFIQDLDDNISIVEISYGFPMNNFLDGSAGYWDDDLAWHPGAFNLQEWIIDIMIK